jgi:hypothetical protein
VGKIDDRHFATPGNTSGLKGVADDDGADDGESGIAGPQMGYGMSSVGCGFVLK